MPSHKVHCVLPYSPERLFDLAADVEQYPEFLPWWAAARIREREGDVYYTDQIVRFGIVRRRFSSKTVLRCPERIDVTSTDRSFRHFSLTWAFDPVPQGGCRVTLHANLGLRSRFLQNLFGWAFTGLAGQIISAFETRAHQLYGPSPPPFSGPDPCTPGGAAGRAVE